MHNQIPFTANTNPCVNQSIGAGIVFDELRSCYGQVLLKPPPMVMTAEELL
jgi:hypothetical protein